jgi:protein tyrosine/serine phosphatase
MQLKICLTLTALLISSAYADSSIPIKNFHQVSDDVYRGAQPGAAGMEYLKSIQVKTDLDLEHFQWLTGGAERREAAAGAIDFVSEPILTLPDQLSVAQPDLNEQEMNRIIDILGDPNGYPLYVHCHRGMDRTGLVIGLYRVLYENWAPAAAWNEMLQYGYHTSYVTLTRYFEEKTGWAPPGT